MGYLYSLTNKTNNKKFIGKSNLEKDTLKKLLFKALRKKKHYNKLLQKEYQNFLFDFEIIESDNVLEDFDNIIKDEDLLNPIKGYNVFNDLQNRKGRHKKVNLYTEDICLLYLFHPQVQFWVNVLGLERNTISNRLGNYGLFDDCYYYQTIARYDDYYLKAIREMFIDGECYTANQIMDRMMNRYEISSQLRITPRKVSKFFAASNVPRKSKKQNGSLVFCPDCYNCEDCDNDDNK